MKFNNAKTSSKKATKPQTKVNNKTTAKTKPTIAQKTATKTATKPITKTTKPQEVKTQALQQTKPVEELKPIETIAKQDIAETKTPETTNIEQNTIPEVSKTTIPTNIAKTDKINIKNTLKNQTNMPIGILAGAVILLLLLLSKLSHKKESAYNIPNLKHHEFEYEPQQQEEMPEEIKDMTWQEKYKFMKEKEGNFTQPNTENNIETIEEQQPSFNEEFEHTVQINNDKEVENIESYETIEVFDEIEQTNEPEKYAPFGLNKTPINEGFESDASKNKEQEIELADLNDFSDIEPTIDVMHRHAPNIEEIEPLKIEEQPKTKPQTISNPIEPTLINQAKISKTKGFYLIRYNNEVALMGYINEQVFLLHTFKNQQQSFVQTRLTEKQKGSEVYLVRSENYKSLIKVTNNSMQTLMKL